MKEELFNSFLKTAKKKTYGFSFTIIKDEETWYLLPFAVNRGGTWNGLIPFAPTAVAKEFESLLKEAILKDEWHDKNGDIKTDYPTRLVITKDLEKEGLRQENKKLKERLKVLHTQCNSLIFNSNGIKRKIRHKKNIKNKRREEKRNEKS